MQFSRSAAVLVISLAIVSGCKRPELDSERSERTGDPRPFDVRGSSGHSEASSLRYQVAWKEMLVPGGSREGTCLGDRPRNGERDVIGPVRRGVVPERAQDLAVEDQENAGHLE